MLAGLAALMNNSSGESHGYPVCRASLPCSNSPPLFSARRGRRPSISSARLRNSPRLEARSSDA